MKAESRGRTAADDRELNENLRSRTKRFALRIIKAFSFLQRRGEVHRVVGRQMLRSGTSVGAQYREACGARSSAEFVSKMNSALQELDETAYWLELLAESGASTKNKLENLMQEADELIRIFVTCIKNAKDDGS